MKVKCLVHDCNNKIEVTPKRWIYYKLWRYGDICHKCFKETATKILTVKNET